ncbi:MAG: CBS domain-containing protein [Spirochaetales bacterium]|uniref:CBS domain-containing protein n=1 Tax=Candidatus Thalassospirochaeta sargassi TaxID=3119039 RepID=A0AAJ1IIF2_9SPIO|nr:CBS domain-containing protein [Spirochaetales bacterium]
MNLGDLLKKKGADVVTVKAKNTVETALVIMNEKHIGAVIALEEDGKMAGILSERDLLNVCHKCGEVKYVHEIMTPRAKVKTLSPKASLQEAMKVFTDARIRHLPIMDGEKLVGIISIGDAVKAMLDAVEQENKYLNEYITGQNI